MCMCSPFLGSILTLADLNSVYKNLIKAAGNWKDLGLALGLGHPTLDDIEHDYHRNKDCLREMLATRLKTGPLTYSEICQSLREPTVRQDALADAIKEEFTGVNSHEAPRLYNKYSLSRHQLNIEICIWFVDHSLLCS